MNKIKFIICLIVFFTGTSVLVQGQTREELERQRQELKNQIEQTEKLLKNNKQQTKESLLQWKLINNKLQLQDRMIDNINRDLNMLDNNMVTISRDVKRYDRLLDTLKQEYAKSMVYAYKNRSNYDFLNFIFSSANFNDAIKRITYLKSYRTYREMQGQNIIRTQDLRKNRLKDLSGIKEKKSATLEIQSKELKTLEQQQQEKDRILAELKKQGKQLNKEMAAKKKQMQKVDLAITAAINRAIREAREAAAKAAAEKKRLEIAAAKERESKSGEPVSTTIPSKAKPETKPVKPPESVLLNAENIRLNENFEKNRNALPWPVDRGVVLMHYGQNKLPSGTVMDITCITVSSDIGTPVKSVFDGTVSTVVPIDDMQMVVIQHGRYFTTYSNLTNVTVQKGQSVKTGQTIGKVAANFDGIGAIDFYLSNEKTNLNPESWLRDR